jgi:branched-chain amino acid transport system permease protein
VSLFLQQTANGVALGAVYAMFAAGFSLMFATLGIFNIAHGSYAVWGAIAALWSAERLGAPFAVCALVAVVAAGAIGVVVDRLVFEPIRRRGVGTMATMITSIGVWMMLGELAQHATDAQVQRFPVGTISDRLVRVGDIALPFVNWLNIAVALLVVAALHALLRHTPLGKAMRAVGHGGLPASLSGIDPRFVAAVTAFVAAGIAGLAGTLSGLATSNVSYTMGEGLLLRGFAAVIVGGVGDVRGAAVGGVLIGVSEVLAGQYVSNSFRDALTFGMLLVLLVVRPRGVFAQPTGARA